MFTGLIEEIGSIQELQLIGGSADITINCNRLTDGLQIGDSVAVNGVCLTTTRFNRASFSAIATPETLRRTNLGTLSNGSKVNLERSLTLQSRLGGHMVQGHIDGTAKVASITHEGEAQRWEFYLPVEISKYLIFKGSVAINGVSLTVASIENNQLAVALIPKTIELTTFQYLNVGDSVNIEVDMIGKYVFRFMEQAQVKV